MMNITILWKVLFLECWMAWGAVFATIEDQFQALYPEVDGHIVCTDLNRIVLGTCSAPYNRMAIRQKDQTNILESRLKDSYFEDAWKSTLPIEFCLNGQVYTGGYKTRTIEKKSDDLITAMEILFLYIPSSSSTSSLPPPSTPVVAATTPDPPLEGEASLPPCSSSYVDKRSGTQTGGFKRYALLPSSHDAYFKILSLKRPFN